MDTPRFISTKQFQDHLALSRQWATDPVAGLHGPGSIMWRVSRESIGFLGAWRAALLQLAHPWVAQAIAHHSKTKADPIGRFHRTFRTVFTMVFGSMEQVQRVSQALHELHGGIQGRMEESTGRFGKGSHYQANEVNAMNWVNATLWDTAMTVYELINGPMDPVDKEQYYQEAKITSSLFGIPLEGLPDSWEDFMEYNRMMWDSDVLGVGEVGREMGRFLFQVDQLPFHRAWMPMMKVITAEIMPPRFREEFELPPPSEKTRRQFERSIKWIRRGYHVTPKRIRYVPTYFEAMQRIKGKKKLDRFTRTANRVWIGQPELVFGS